MTKGDSGQVGRDFRGEKKDIGPGRSLSSSSGKDQVSSPKPHLKRKAVEVLRLILGNYPRDWVFFGGGVLRSGSWYKYRLQKQAILSFLQRKSSRLCHFGLEGNTNASLNVPF